MICHMATSTATSIHDLIERVQRYNPNAQVDLIRRAYDFSARAHEGQVRRSGEPYLQHPLAVAKVLATLKLDVSAIVAGLLHDTVEDTVCTREQIEAEFGKDIARLVDGVTKIGQIPFKSYEEKQAENFRKMLISMADDIRVILIKLADRLHNMRTLEHLNPAHQKTVAQETLDIYAPLANRLGIGWMKAELEDLCFKALKPDVYTALAERVAKRIEERERYIQEVTAVVKAKLAEHGLVGELAGRSKHLYSIYQKMEHQGVSFDEVYDLTAIRVITDTQMNCYAIMGLIHSLWRPVPGRFKDYIGVSFRSGPTRCTGSARKGLRRTGRTRNRARSTRRRSASSRGCASSWNPTRMSRTTGSSWSPSSWTSTRTWSTSLLPRAR